jgi:hypothetical protein
MTLTPQRTANEDQSIPELFRELSQDLGLLVRQEAQLARAEMNSKLRRLAVDLISLGAGGFVLLIAGLAVTASLILLLIRPVGLAPWLAALVVGLALALAGGLMLLRGARDLKETDPAPRRTLEHIKEDVQWMKEHRP